jgi:hypothetical protein
MARPNQADLLGLIITMLTPMFLFTAVGNLTHARAAAPETLASYRVEARHDLITVAKIIAFGLATIGSLSRSMEDDLTLNQILRLRGNATDRSEHRNRQALEKSRTSHRRTTRRSQNRHRCPHRHHAGAPATDRR